MSSALTTMRPKGALWQNAGLNFLFLIFKNLNNRIDFLANNIHIELQTDKQYQ